MTVRSVVDIDVNDESFKKFSDLFEKYRTALEKTPSAWAAVSKENKAAQSSFNAIASALLAQNELARRLKNEQAEASRSARTQESTWGKMSGHAKSFAGSVAEATRSLLRWTALTSVVSGLLGAGGLFGIDRLAASVSSTRRTAAGLGISYGREQAFGLNFGRFVDPGSTLSGVAAGLFDVTSPQYRALLAAGVSRSTLQSGNAADVSAALLERLPGLFKGKSRGQIAPLMHAYGLDQILSQEDVLRYLSAPPNERRAQQQAYKRDAAGLDLSPGTQRSWQDFLTQLSRAGREIETVFVKGLVGLATPLSNLSKAVADFFTTLLSNDKLKSWIDDLAAGIEHFAKWLNNGGIDKITTDLAYLGRAVEAAAKWIISFVKPDASAPTNPITGEPQTPLDDLRDKVFGKGGPSTVGPGVPLGPLPPSKRPFWPWSKSSYSGGAHYQPASYEAGGVPPDLLARIAGVESGGNTNAVSPTGAAGMFQFTRGTARQYGVANPFDPWQSAAGAAKYLTDLLKEFGGDVRKAVTAYNWGPGNVEAAVQRYGSDWARHAPAGGDPNYADKVLGSRGGLPYARGRGGRSRVDIYNNTGGNAITIASQMA
jgi:hypothetical protein